MIFQKALSYLSTVWKKLTGKKIGTEYYNIYHPDFHNQIELAFEVQGKKYYRFAKETDMKWGRYMYLQTFLHEQSLRIDLELLKGYVGMIRKAITGKNGQIDLSTVYKIASQLESRCELAFEEETTYRLASVLYFDDQEDLYGYDLKHNETKIAAWKEDKVVDFFYSQPMSELLGLSDTSPTDLQKYMVQAREVLKDLTIETPEP